MKSKLLVLFLACFCCWLNVASAGGTTPVAAVAWRQLVFAATHPAGQVSVTIDSAQSDASELRSAAGGQGSALMPQQGLLQRLTAEINATSLFLDKQWRGQVWFLEDGTALQRSRFKPGKKGDFRLYRYTSDGVFRKRFEPEGGRQAKLPPEQWGKVKDKFFPYGPGKSDCGPILDAFGLIYPLSAHGLEADPGSGICVFNKKVLYRVRLGAGESPPLRLALIQGPRDLVERLSKGVVPQVVVLRAEPLASTEQDRELFEFMGLEGEIAVYLDRKTGLPLRLSGELTGFGRVDLDLNSVRMRQ